MHVLYNSHQVKCTCRPNDQTNINFFNLLYYVEVFWGYLHLMSDLGASFLNWQAIAHSNILLKLGSLDKWATNNNTKFMSFKLLNCAESSILAIWYQLSYLIFLSTSNKLESKWYIDFYHWQNKHTLLWIIILGQRY